MTIRDLQQMLAEFARERDWEQFHTPKNLAMALAGETGELVEIFQWLTPEESAAVMADPDRARAVRHEMADVLAYLLRLADVTGVDLARALTEKTEINRRRFPVRRTPRGRGPAHGAAGEGDGA
ncbi:nucleotide pyrophosphohydrolase [Streptomyces aidingensis]|uniref:NTP pyrophosphatase, house-cleaning of non-canonical NTPs n=1 Tax=Streptomyces aidingensis TaxID=910347 RepID=A0A1I1PII2_9ACTN|nr:nucleotide pyrophosphohydrolase [Streptomyces aidingensis]SFD09587.1 NTP pyrophosphatase, house-cleaning of non-canonical NTPs [Streptomyces aidingensis]